MTPNFTLQTRKKVNDAELMGARGSLKKVGGVEEIESKLTKINQEVCLLCLILVKIVLFNLLYRTTDE